MGVTISGNMPIVLRSSAMPRVPKNTPEDTAPATDDLFGEVPPRPEGLRIGLEDEPEVPKTTPKGPGRPAGSKNKSAGPKAPPPPAPTVIPAQAPDELVNGIYRGLSGVLGVISGRWYPDLPATTRQEVLEFSREELDDLRQPTAKLLAKYGAMWLMKYGDEVALIMTLTTVLGNKFQSLHEAAMKHQHHNPGHSPRVHVVPPITTSGDNRPN